VGIRVLFYYDADSLPDFLLSVQDWELSLAAGTKQKMGKRASRLHAGWFSVGFISYFIIPPFITFRLLFIRKLFLFYTVGGMGGFIPSLHVTRKIPMVHDGRRAFFSSG
jgi:hypothetical protein